MSDSDREKEAILQGALRLVFDASRERALLYRLAPHLVQPLPFLFPIYQETGRSPCFSLIMDQLAAETIQVSFENHVITRQLRTFLCNAVGWLQLRRDADEAGPMDSTTRGSTHLDSTIHAKPIDP